MNAPAGPPAAPTLPEALRALVQALHEPLLLLSPQGEVLAATAAAAPVLGTGTAPLAGRALSTLFADPPATLQGLLRQGLRSGGRMPVRLHPPATSGAPAAPQRGDLTRVAGADGKPWLLLRLQPQAASANRFLALTERIHALQHEVARRREAEHQLLEQREWLQVVLRSIGDAVMATDEQARVVFMNPVAESLSGWAAHEAVGQPVSTVFRIVNESSRETVPCPVGEALRIRRTVGLARGTLLVSRDGTERPIDDAAAPIIDARRRLRGAVLVFREISERVAAEHQRRTLENQLRNAQKMEAVGTLAGGIAHDFNNVLSSILGSAALARDELGTEHPVQQRLAQIEGAGRRARELVRKILAFGRRQPQDLRRQALQPLVEETVALLRSTLPATADLQVDMGAEPLHVLADGTQLQQVLMNLCTNAWHALQGSTGRIRIALDTVDGEAPAGLVSGFGPWVPGRYARLSVGDNGCGMDEATQRRIFEPFFTTKPRGQGTGLGLAVVHGIVAEHRGALALQSVPGAGTRFELLLPLTAAPERELAVGSLPTVPPPQGRGEHVFYVDDDEVLALTVQALLARAGFTPHTFGDADEALRRLAADPGQCHIFVSDFNMPQMNGLELLTQVRQLCPALPLVVASGYVSDDLEQGARQLGVTGILHKEELFETLVPLLAEMLGPAPGARPAQPPLP